jgi:hypothetical protein
MIGWPVPILKQVMSSKDIVEAMAYQRINPHSQSRFDLRSAIVASTIANINRGKGTRPYKPSDFMPDYSGKKQNKVAEQLKAIFSGKS